MDTKILVKKLTERIKVRRQEEEAKENNIYIKARGGKVKFKHLSNDDYADICALKDLIYSKYLNDEKLLKILKAKRFKFKFLRTLNAQVIDLISALREHGVDYVAMNYENKMNILEQEKM